MCRQLLVLGALAETPEPFQHVFGLAKAEAGNRFERVLAIDLLEPQTGQGMRAFFRVGENCLEVMGHALAMRFEHRGEGSPVVKVHRAGDLHPLGFAGWQHMRLGIVDVLQPMFKAAQELIGIDELLYALCRQQMPVDESRQDAERRTSLQNAVAPAANELKDLCDEFDLANPAGAELDMVGLVLARHFAPDLGMQVTHGIDCPEVEVLAVDEGADDFLQRGNPDGLLVVASVHDPRLDPGIAFPFTPLRDQVVFQRNERADERPGIAVRAQAHVDAKDLPVAGDFGEGSDQFLAEPGEKFVGLNFAPRFG